LPQTPLGELTALPQTLWLDLRGPTSKGEEGRGRKGENRRKGPKGRRWKGGKGGKERGKGREVEGEGVDIAWPRL